MAPSWQTWRSFVPLLILLCLVVSKHSSSEEVEANEREIVGTESEISDIYIDLEPQALLDGNEESTEKIKRQPLSWQNLTVKALYREVLLLSFCLFYLFNVIRGRIINRHIAKCWAKTFVKPGGIFDRNFALLGPGDSRARFPLYAESASEYQFYCSGRRYCRFLTATLELKRRPDLFSLLLGVLFPEDDKLDIEVVMNQINMPQITLAVATKKIIKTMLKEEGGEDDVRNLAHRMEVAKDKISSWPAEKLVVYAEHSSIFYDLMTDQIVDLVFGKTAFEKHGHLFRQLHFTSNSSFGPEDQRSVLRFSFNLPPKEDMEALKTLMTSVFYFVDIVGTYKLSPDLKKRGEKLRAELVKKDSKDKQKEKERQDALEERRLAKRLDEVEKLKRMTPDQREKYEQRKTKIESGRQQRKFVKKG